jgi:hypothetical protein
MPNIYDVFSFLDIQKKQLIAGYDMLRNERLAASERHVVLVGVLIALGSVYEGIGVACDLQPSLLPLRELFKIELQCWYRLRNDVAHVFQRVFAPARDGQNVPWIPGGLRVASYDPSTDIVSTGNEPEASTVLWTAVERAFELCRLMELVHHRVNEEAYSQYSLPVRELIDAVRDEIRAESATKAAPSIP